MGDTGEEKPEAGDTHTRRQPRVGAQRWWEWEEYEEGKSKKGVGAEEGGARGGRVVEASMCMCAREG